MSYLASGWKAGETLWFFDTERDEPSINVCACGEPIPEEVGHCEECRDWDAALQREAAYHERLKRQAEPWWWYAYENPEESE